MRFLVILLCQLTACSPDPPATRFDCPRCGSTVACKGCRFGNEDSW